MDKLTKEQPAETKCPPTDIGIVGQHSELHLSSRPKTQVIRIPGGRLSDGSGE